MSDRPLSPQHPAPIAPAADVTMPDDPRLHQALLRLQASRRRLEHAWIAPPAPAGTGAGRAWQFGGLSGLLRHLRRRVAHVPGLAPMVELVEHAWQRHPWRLVGRTVADEVVPPVMRVVRRHPVATTGLALGAGFALVWFKPWRHAWAADQINQAPRRLSRWLVRQAGAVPVHTFLTTLLAGLAAARATAPAEPRAEPAAPAAQGAHP